MELTMSARLARGIEDELVSIPYFLTITKHFYLGAGNLQSVHDACAVSSLLSEPSPQPQQ